MVGGRGGGGNGGVGVGRGICRTHLLNPICVNAGRENSTHMCRIFILQIESAGVGPLIGAGINYPSSESGFPFSLFLQQASSVAKIDKYRRKENVLVFLLG